MNTRTRLWHSGRRQPKPAPLWALIALAAVLLLSRALVDIRPVRGQSMMPTLHEGEWVLIFKPAYTLGSPHYGELAVYRAPGGEVWIKRVLGCPGDLLEAQNGGLLRNGEAVAEPYVEDGTADFAPLKAWDGQYLLLGDNRADSFDSRDPALGAIPQEELYGRAVGVVWPLSAWRGL